MSLVPLIEYDDVENPEVKAIYDEIRAELGFGIVPNLFKSMAHRPGFLRANWIKFRSTILYGEIPRTLKEMVGVSISQANGSSYALKVHLHGLSALGMSEEVLNLLIEDFDACPLPDREKTAIRFGLFAATHPHQMTAERFTEMRDHGLTDDEIYELIATANLFTGVNQYTDAIKLEVDAL